MMEKEIKDTVGAAWDELLTVNNKLCCIAGLIDPRDSDHGLVLDFTESIGLAELIKECVSKISEVMENLEINEKEGIAL